MLNFCKNPSLRLSSLYLKKCCFFFSTGLPGFEDVPHPPKINDHPYQQLDWNIVQIWNLARTLGVGWLLVSSAMFLNYYLEGEWTLFHDYGAFILITLVVRWNLKIWLMRPVVSTRVFISNFNSEPITNEDVGRGDSIWGTAHPNLGIPVVSDEIMILLSVTKCMQDVWDKSRDSRQSNHRWAPY